MYVQSSTTYISSVEYMITNNDLFLLYQVHVSSSCTCHVPCRKPFRPMGDKCDAADQNSFPLKCLRCLPSATHMTRSAYMYTICACVQYVYIHMYVSHPAITWFGQGGYTCGAKITRRCGGSAISRHAPAYRTVEERPRNRRALS